ncbi:MAG: hypothetical protein RIA69_02495 [Cyclobacteriaceae bacterium]
MTKKIIPILILLISCSSPTKEHLVTQIPPIIEFDKGGQATDLCKEYLVSIRNERSLLKTSYYFANGKIDSEDHHLNSTWTRKGKRIYYDYQDTLLVQRRLYLDNGDSTKAIYHYDDNGLLLKEEHYDFEKRIREDVDKGLGSSEGCIITEDDYEKERTWRRRSIINYQYDSLGRKIEYYAPSIHWNRQNRYTWIYDDNNRVVEHRSYDHNRLIWAKTYSYETNSLEITRTWFDHEGNPQHLKKNHEYSPELTFRYTLNEIEQPITEVVSNEKGELRSQETSKYDEEGRIVETKQFNSEGQHLTTHLFEYER